MELRAALQSPLDALPSPSPVLGRITAALTGQDVSVAEVVEMVKVDPGVSSRILRLANSAYIGLPRTVSSLHNAVVLLGLRRVHALVLSCSVGGIASASADLPFRLVDYWRHSVTVAMVCESVARHLKRYEPIDEGEAFCAGLLHDIGKVVVGVCLPAAARRGVAYCRRSGRPYYLAEDPEASHTKAGALLAQRWKYPPDLTAAIEMHHAPGREPTFARMVAVVHLCDIVAHVVGMRTVAEEAVPSFDECAVARVGLEPERLRVIARDVLEDERRVEAMVDAVGEG
jgi:putative nucleotidyltransferase with HDIG domain